MHASISIYVSLGNNQDRLSAKEVENGLREAEEQAQQALDLNPKLSEAKFLVANCRAMLGKSKDALDNLNPLLKVGDNYAERMLTDPALESIKNDITLMVETFNKTVTNGQYSPEERSKCHVRFT